jgi:hypothetical protein
VTTLGPTPDFLVRDLGGNKLHPMLVKAVRLPAAEVPPVILAYMARKIKIPGVRLYQPITLSFFNTNDYKVRRSLEEWQGLFSSYRSNARGERDVFGSSSPPSTVPATTAFATIELTAMNARARDTNQYVFEKAFPTRISGLEFSYDNQDVQMYDVDFEYLTTNQSTNPSTRSGLRF